MCPDMEFFLDRIFSYSVLMRENTNQKKTPYLDTFHAVTDPFVINLGCLSDHTYDRLPNIFDEDNNSLNERKISPSQRN